MKLLGRKKDNTPSDDASSEDAARGRPADVKESGATAPKGRPTPKRSEATRKRGPVAPAPMTSAEARRRRKEMAPEAQPRGTQNGEGRNAAPPWPNAAKR